MRAVGEAGPFVGPMRAEGELAVGQERLAWAIGPYE